MPICKKSCTPALHQRQPAPGVGCSGSRRGMWWPLHRTCSALQRWMPRTSASYYVSWRLQSGRASLRWAQHPSESPAQPLSGTWGVRPPGLGPWAALQAPLHLIRRRHLGLASSSPDTPRVSSLRETYKLTWG